MVCGPRVIVPHFHIHREIRSGNLDDAAVADAGGTSLTSELPRGILPEKERRHIRRRAGRVDADIEKFHAVFGERSR